MYTLKNICKHVYRLTDAKTRVPSDWESSPNTCDPNQATAHALGEVQLSLEKSNGKAMNRNWSNQKANPAHKKKTGN